MPSTPAATLDLLTFSPLTITLRASLHAAPKSLQDIPISSNQLARRRTVAAHLVLP